MYHEAEKTNVCCEISFLNHQSRISECWWFNMLMIFCMDLGRHLFLLLFFYRWQFIRWNNIPARLSYMSGGAMSRSYNLPKQHLYETMVYFWTTLFLISTSTSLNRSYRFLLRRNQSFLSMEVTQVLVKSLVISKLDYCESLPSTSPATDPERTPSSSNPRSRSHCCVPSWLLIPIQHHTAFKTLELANWPLAIIRHLSNPTLNHVPFRL